MAPTAEPRAIHVVAVVGSAGGIGALQVVLGGLPAELDASVLAIIHLTPLAPSVLPAILGRATKLRVEQAVDAAPLEPGVDVLLLSLAGNHRGPCTAIVLSGTGIDGAAGTAAVKRAGGRVLAQDEATSQYFGMPGAAILAGGVDEVLPLTEIAPAVLEWAPVAP